LFSLASKVVTTFILEERGKLQLLLRASLGNVVDEAV
jgi:hypothetical protein